MNESTQSKIFIDDKPYPIPIEMRPLWRIGLILICIKTVGAEKLYLSIKKTNILVWMLIRKTKWPEYINYLLDLESTIPLISADQSTYKAIEFSVAKKLIKIQDDRLHIEQTGIDLIELITANQIMNDEIDFLLQYGKKLTDLKLKGLTGKI